MGRTLAALASTLPLSIVLLSIVLLSVVGTNAACGQDISDRDRAIALQEEGTRLYDAGRFDDAANIFHRAYGVYPAPALLFNEGRSLERAGRAEEALSVYRLYAEQNPDAPDRAEVEAAIARLAEATAPPRSEAPTPEGGSDSALDVLAWTLAIIGAGALATGAGFWVMADDRAAAARAESFHVDAWPLAEQAAQFDTVSLSLVLAGGAVLVGGVIGIVLSAVGGGNDAHSSASVFGPDARVHF